MEAIEGDLPGLVEAQDSAWECQFSSVTDEKKMRPENDGKKTLTLLPFPLLYSWKEDCSLFFSVRRPYLIFKLQRHRAKLHPH